MKITAYNNHIIDIALPADFNAESAVALPALIDPHVHFRTPGHEYKEDWKTGAAAALSGGVATVMDMPNNNPAITTLALLEQKQRIINQQLREAGPRLRYYLYFGATPHNSEEFEKVKGQVVGIKIFMGSSTGDLLVDKKEDQEKIFQRAAELNMLVAVHAEDEGEVKNEKLKVKNPTVFDHPKIHSREAANKATAQAIGLAEKYGTRLYICHMSTKEQVKMVREAKRTGIAVYGEVTPLYLFFNKDVYSSLGTLVQTNPSLMDEEDRLALWEGINDGTIDTIGTDHAPHTLEEKARPYGEAPSGTPQMETSLPLLLDAHNNGKITLEKIVELTHTNPRKIFNLQETNDWVIVDLNLEKEVRNENLKTKCGWSPFHGWRLKGWPVKIVKSEE